MVYKDFLHISQEVGQGVLTGAGRLLRPVRYSLNELRITNESSMPKFDLHVVVTVYKVIFGEFEQICTSLWNLLSIFFLFFFNELWRGWNLQDHNRFTLRCHKSIVIIWTNKHHFWITGTYFTYLSQKGVYVNFWSRIGKQVPSQEWHFQATWQETLSFQVFRILSEGLSALPCFTLQLTFLIDYLACKHAKNFTIWKQFL